MLISQVVSVLQSAAAAHGDLPVKFDPVSGRNYFAADVDTVRTMAAAVGVPRGMKAGEKYVILESDG